MIRNIIEILVGDKANFDIDRFIVAEDGDGAVGFARTKVFNYDCLELASLGVLPGYQRLGIGSRLLQEILVKEKQRPIYLLTGTRYENFYSRKIGVVK